MVKESVNIKLMSGLPEWIVSLELVKFGFPEGTAPAITHVRTDQVLVMFEACYSIFLICDLFWFCENRNVIELRKLNWPKNLT